MITALFYLITPLAAWFTLTSTGIDLPWWQDALVFVAILLLPVATRGLIQPKVELLIQDSHDKDGMVTRRVYSLVASSLWYRFLPVWGHIRSYPGYLHPDEESRLAREFDVTRFTDKRPLEFLLKERGGNTIGRPPGGLLNHIPIAMNASTFLEVRLLFPFPYLPIWSKFYLVDNYGIEADSIKLQEWHRGWGW